MTATVTAPVSLGMLTDDAALLSFEHQLHLEDVLGEHSWDVDLQAGTFAFTGANPLQCTGVHLLGTAAPGPRTWLWSWANPGAFPHSTTRLAESLRAFGAHHGIRVLTQPEVPFAELTGAADQPMYAVTPLIEAAKAVTGSWTSYTGDAGGGTRAAFLVEHPDFTLPPVDPARVLRVLQQGVAQLPITDHRRAIHTYATRRPLGIEAAHDWSWARLTGNGLDVRISFYGTRVAAIDAVPAAVVTVPPTAPSAADVSAPPSA